MVSHVVSRYAYKDARQRVSGSEEGASAFPVLLTLKAENYCFQNSGSRECNFSERCKERKEMKFPVNGKDRVTQNCMRFVHRMIT